MHYLYIQSVLVPFFNLRCVRNQGSELSLLFYDTVRLRLSEGNEGALVTYIFMCIAKLFTSGKTEKLLSFAANIRVNIYLVMKE